jgi:hypothetical protein
MSKKKIEFIAENAELLDMLPRPYPASKKLPEWLSNTPSYIGGKKGVDDYSDPSSTIKKCMPVFDSITSGYHMPLISDVWVENLGNQQINFKWAWEVTPVVAFQRPEGYSTYPISDEYHKSIFKWISPWIVKTPPGWSCLFMHPMHHDHLPFYSLPAVVDTDKHPSFINFPFLLKKNFAGLIERDTPMIQIIPFKREDFISEFSHDNGFFKRQWNKAHSVFFDRYKRFFRSQKKYEQGGEKKCPFAFLHNKNK